MWGTLLLELGSDLLILTRGVVVQQAAMTYYWKPIEELPEEWKGLLQEDLRSLAAIWKEQAARLKESTSWQHFNDRLRREWAIEAGVIEKLYSIDRGITEILIEKGIEASLIPHGATDKPVEQIVPILKDQEAALEFVFDFVTQKRQLSTSYIKELHQLLTRHQATVQAKDSLGRLVEIPIERGDWKKLPNNPTRPDGQLHEYCPPEHVASEMDRLMEMHARHVAQKVAPEVEAAWLHHRFTQIHPFQDGNGRVARALASLVFLRAGWFPLVVNRDARSDYLTALENADTGDLVALVELCAKNQKDFFIRALSLSEDVLYRHDPLEHVISAAADKIKAKELAKLKVMQDKACALSRILEDSVYERLHAVSDKLRAELSSIHGFACTVDRSNEKTDFWFKRDIIEVAKKFGYYADTRSYRQWVRLRIWEQRQTDLVVSFHSLGVHPLGVIAISAFVEHRDRSDEETTIEGPYEASKELFQFSYRDEKQHLIQRFDKWLSDVILVGLDQWRRQL